MPSDELNDEIERAAQNLNMTAMGALRGAQGKVLKKYAGDDAEVDETNYAAAERLYLEDVVPDHVDLDAEIASALAGSSDAAEELREEEERQNAQNGPGDDELGALKPDNPDGNLDHDAWKQRKREDVRRATGEPTPSERVNARVPAEEASDEEITALQPGEDGQQAREDAAPSHFTRTPGVDEDGE